MNTCSFKYAHNNKCQAAAVKAVFLAKKLSSRSDGVTVDHPWPSAVIASANVGIKVRGGQMWYPLTHLETPILPRCLAKQDSS